jgi:hypothetical protein
MPSQIPPHLIEAVTKAVGVKFASDSPLEGRVHCELVSEIRCRFR